MIMHTLVIAGAAYREAVRSRIFLNLLITCGLFLVGGVFLDSIDIADSGRVYHDVAHAGISVGGSMVALFLGVTLIASDVERKTLHILLARPIARGELLVGKYLGLTAVLVVNTAVLMLAYALIMIAGIGIAPSALQLLSIALLFWQFSLVAAIAVMFSALSTPTTAAIFALFVYIIGRLGSQVELIAERSQTEVFRTLSNIIRVITPDLTRFDLVSLSSPPSLHLLLFQGLYALCWCIALLATATLLFSRRDFK